MAGRRRTSKLRASLAFDAGARPAMTLIAPPPLLEPFAQVSCDVGPVISLGPSPLGERRYVPLLGGTVSGPGLEGVIEPGGVDWQIVRADGALDIDAHYVVLTPDGARVEVQSKGMRHGPPEVLAALARGEAVPPEAYFFRTVVRFTTGAARWDSLNRTLAIARGRREAACVKLDFYRVT